ncbi:MAG: hypothetical protein ACJAZ8_000612 [Planctomycetota bacterium]|jgi:hypothetical protein
MNIQTVTLVLAIFLTTSCIGNHQFADHSDRLPNIGQLEEARLATTAESAELGLLDMTWIPLVTMRIKRYGASEPLMPDGSTLSEIEAYGPLVMVGHHEEWLFDDKSDLYEQREQSSLLWGLWSSWSTKVRVTTGWRVESRQSLLWGLLGWPSTFYTSEI